ncbi:unnamed protein product [Dovyalis caffra]|uniref:Uncharacterized protein n=1 Tax=Dovyalis caffra TaxID=77055 RepID=A0AAV1RRH9_9ROSI|nr:unnamed protein product [Dovyalis caffra]
MDNIALSKALIVLANNKATLNGMFFVSGNKNSANEVLIATKLAKKMTKSIFMRQKNGKKLLDNKEIEKHVNRDCDALPG